MRHWKSLTDRDYIFAFDLNGKDVTLTIERITAGTIVGERGKKNKKPVAFFRETKVDPDTEKKKGLALNTTNCKTIAAMYGDDVDQWPGKRITLYPTTTEMGGKTVDCIRVRPRIPSGASKGKLNEPEQAQLPESDDDTPTGDPEPPEPGSNG